MAPEYRIHVLPSRDKAFKNTLSQLSGVSVLSITALEQANDERLEKESEAFMVKLIEILLRRDSPTLGIGDLGVAKEINRAAGQYLSDEAPLAFLELPTQKGKKLTGIDAGFKSNYSRTLNALKRARLRTIGDIRDTEPFMLARVRQMQMSSAMFIKTIFARPQQSETK